MKKREHQKRMRWNRGLRHLCTLCGFKKILCKACLLFHCSLVIKWILKTLFSFIPWLLNFSDLSNYGSNLRKRYALRLLSKCLVRSTLLPIGGKVPPTLWFSSIPWWAFFSLALHLLQNGANFIQKLTLGFKNHMSNLDNFR